MTVVMECSRKSCITLIYGYALLNDYMNILEGGLHNFNWWLHTNE